MWSLPLSVSTGETKKDSSMMAELVCHMLTRLERLGLRLSDTVLRLVSDNASRELKNSICSQVPRLPT